jgi:hypothetical protein
VTGAKRGDDNGGDHHPTGQGPHCPVPDCHGVPGQDCLECCGEGSFIRRACPLCGDPGWDYVNGTDDRDGMACRISCGCHWTSDAPGWRGQVLPSKTV